jgi:hypothetical protein
MKARQIRRLAGTTTGCCSNKAPCIEEKQRVSQPAVRYAQRNKTKMNKYMHEHTQVYIWYVSLSRNDSESELGNQLSGILRKESQYARQPAVHTSTHIKVLTSSAASLGKRRAAPTLCPSTKDPGNQLAWGRSLCGRAAHRRSRR